LAPWVNTPSGRYEVRAYNQAGALVATTEATAGPQEMTTAPLGNLEIAVYEFLAR
jgi:hypothetical protein